MLRAAASITGLNLISRVTGFARVLAIGAALGVSSLGDVYQAANVVSNVLFEVLAGGVFASALVPTFAGLVDAGRAPDARALASAILGRVLLLLGGVVLVAMVLVPFLADLLTSDGAAGGDPEPLARFLLWFFLPQVLLYAVGAVCTSLLHAHHRFVAAAAAPIANNVVVIATMAVFYAVAEPADGFAIGTAQKLTLALGTTGGVLAMSVVPLLALRRIGQQPRPSLAPAPVRAILRQGAWAAGHLGVNQLVAFAAVIFAARTTGGVVANQIALTFFLLPHALVAHPIFTALFPRLSVSAARDDPDVFVRDLREGYQAMVVLLAPASAVLAVAGGDLLLAVRAGALDAAGVGFAGSVLTAYAAGLLGYSAFFMLTRAAWAKNDMKTPALINAMSGVGAVAAMTAISVLYDGTGAVVGLALAQAAAFTVAAVALYLRLRIELSLLDLAGPTGRAILAGGVAVTAGLAVGLLLPSASRVTAALSTVAVTTAAGLAALAILVAAQAPELALVRRQVASVLPGRSR